MEKQRLSISNRRRFVNTLRLSFHQRVILALASVSAVGLLLTIAIGEFYFQNAVSTHKQNLQELIRIQSTHTLGTLRDELSSVGSYLQSNSELREALISGDATALHGILQKQFERPLANQGFVSLLGLSAFNTKMDVVDEVFDGAKVRQPTRCSELVTYYKSATGLAASRSLGQLCSSGTFALMTPVGGLNPIGYLELVVDPTPALMNLEERLGRPIRIADEGNEFLYQSWNWPIKLGTNSITPSYTLLTPEGLPVINVAASYEAQGVNSMVANTRHTVLAGAVLIIFAATWLALRSLRAQVLGPLESLRLQIARFIQSKCYLNEQIEPSGHTELQSIAAGFNELSGELRQLHERMHVMTLRDPLTQLPNRLHLQQAIEDMVHLAGTSNIQFAVLIMDIDRFKHLNDTLGHTHGDAILLQVSERLRKCIRPTDVIAANRNTADTAYDQTVARLGGDEFAGLFPTIATNDSAATVARNILRAMNLPFIVDRQEFTINLSIGAALFPTHGMDPQTLLRRADIAMYAAKREQKGFMIYHDTMEVETQRLLRLENEMRRAIDAEEFELWYQPLVEIATGKVIRVEALLRWRHNVRGILPPDEFIPLAEQTGLIIPLTKWVLESALGSCVRWREAGIHIGVAVNLSARALTDPSILLILPHLIMRCHLNPQDITLELTESTIMADHKQTIVVLEKIKAMGVNLAIDDFGTGYSALTVLKQLPVNELKIDKSFILDMHNNYNDTAIVRATLDIANHLHLRTVAEGVETYAQLETLINMGTQIAQGFFIAKPLPEDEFVRWYQRFKWADLIRSRSNSELIPS